MSTGPITLQAGIHKVSEYSTNPSAKHIQSANAVVQHNIHKSKQAADRQLQRVSGSEQTVRKNVQNNSKNRKNPNDGQGKNKDKKGNGSGRAIDIQI